MLPEPLEGWEVHVVPGYRAEKEYLCPDCGNPIAPRVGHVVAWPEGYTDDRRHWHRHCWRIHARRGG